MAGVPSDTSQSASRPTTRRSRPVLIAMATIGVALSALIVSPFVPALTWACALAVVAAPLHRRLRRRLTRPGLVAGVGVVVVILTIAAPTVFVGWRVGVEASHSLQQAQVLLDSGALRERLASVPYGQRVYDAAVRAVEGGGGSGGLLASINGAGTVLSATLWSGVQFAVAMFVLFFLFRDEEAVLRTVRAYLPMSSAEATYFLDRVKQMTHATIYGNVATALVQGTLGGVMFAMLGIPGALLWGVAMAILSIIPSAGAFVIWIPAAIVLAAQGDWGKAGVLAVWGSLAVGTIDNLLYPILVGTEVRMHTVPVFLTLVGGILVFGAAGIVLGPVIGAGTIAMIDILKRRQTAERKR